MHVKIVQNQQLLVPKISLNFITVSTSEIETLHYVLVNIKSVCRDERLLLASETNLIFILSFSLLFFFNKARLIQNFSK